MAELHLSARAVIEVGEWVAFDSRETPHTTIISVRDGERQFVFAVRKELQVIGTSDLPRTARDPAGSVALRRQPVDSRHDE